MSAPPVVGLLYPGFGAEDDFPALAKRLGGRIRLPLVHTSVGEDAHRVDALLDLGSADRLAPGARALMGSAPDSVMWACTSGSFVFGWDGARRQVDGLAEMLGLPVSSTSIAFVRAAHALDVKRVAVAASYPEEVSTHFVEFLRRGGIEVLALGSHGITTAAEVGTFDRERVLAMARAGDVAGAQAILIPDTAMHSLAWLDELEAAVGKVVLTANQVTVWQGLRLCGGSTSYKGMGQLFRV
jgi:maleate cis-trans isomerase